jgi:hypothetical protein
MMHTMAGTSGDAVLTLLDACDGLRGSAMTTGDLLLQTQRDSSSGGQHTLV